MKAIWTTAICLAFLASSTGCDGKIAQCNRLIDVINKEQKPLKSKPKLPEDFEASTWALLQSAVHAGRVMEESAFEIVVQDDPYAEDLLVLEPGEIETRKLSDISLMPEGLLNTFSRDEILDLMAFLETLRRSD